MRTKKHRRGRCFLLAMPYPVCYDGKSTKKGENIMRKRCIALVLCLLTLLTLAGCGGGSAKTVTSNGVECYRVDGVYYPAVFGEPQLTGEEITALLDGGDAAEMAVTVSTVPDALRLLKARQQDSEDIDSQDAETTLLRGSSQPRSWVGALLYLLAGDYEESGRIDLFAPDNYYCFCAIKQDGLYYAFDPFEIRGDCWLVLSGENYVNADAQKLADTRGALLAAGSVHHEIAFHLHGKAELGKLRLVDDDQKRGRAVLEQHRFHLRQGCQRIGARLVDDQVVGRMLGQQLLELHRGPRRDIDVEAREHLLELMGVIKAVRDEYDRFPHC